MLKNLKILTTFFFFFFLNITTSYATCPSPISCNSSCPDDCPILEHIINSTCQCTYDKKVAPVLKIGDKEILSPVPQFTSFGDVISILLPYIFVIAGLILFGLLIVNGFNFLTSGGDPKKTEGAKGGITAALIGFGIIIAAYWLTQILEYVLHIKILGP